MLAALQDVRVGDKAGNRAAPAALREHYRRAEMLRSPAAIAALFVADELIRQHKTPNKSGSWRREVVIMTSGEAGRWAVG